ncbi:unnamed protein product (macronuclear) [Paramecium tetraurelia]|uniref:B box-type domain-containing protein n=1 Tax=Paramecium tetraurelia TaxID=5888 RepID=A0BSC8_PARTE|nr:uncharacterized protein GSPATT00031676001 [Paramecium tetraurelia]CAK61445.1 unnamed protein product [Paramecium tetraurelia]|eukprot:XP_001428843.1 hypothetical protein (macronuclear) [Paramecium tetraurelia strain d4-2]
MRACTNHPQEKIQNICIANHQCKRFLCQKCQNSHGVGDLDKLNIEDFNKIIQNQFELFQQKSKSLQIERQKNEFKEFIKEAKNKFERLDQEMSKQFEMIDKEEQYYFELITSHSPKVNYSDQNINSLIEIIRKKLENWNFYKDGFFQQLMRIKNNLEETLSQCLNNIITYNSLDCKGLKRFCAQLQETQFQVIYTKNMEMVYVLDGEILRCDSIEDYNNKPQIMKNLQQIKHLKWHGSFNLEYKKQGVWYPTWKGLKIDAGGSYLNGLKQGNWKELGQNYWEKAEVFQQGNYQNNQKKGVWQIIRKNKQTHESTYSDHGVKIGRGFDLHDNYHEGNQVIFNGEYKQGKKIGKWNTLLKEKLLCSGEYDEQGIKRGQWEELHNNFFECNDLIESGLYLGSQIGQLPISQKSGQWNIKFEGNVIGGGQYQNGFKNGLWTEVHDQFSQQNQIFYQGAYKNGKKVEDWKILYKREEASKADLIGGGKYDENQLKTGNWKELHENFHIYGQIIYQGVYSKGKKQQKWVIQYRSQSEQNIIEIGGGLYDSEGRKDNLWVELHQNFSGQREVLLKGKYKNGKKYDKWEILQMMDNKDRIQGIQEEDVNDENQLKHGKWTDLYENFNNDAQVRYKGEYKNGKKQGAWKIDLRETKVAKIEMTIGNGDYDENGRKTGEWVELVDDYDKWKQIIYKGVYVEGVKVGDWNQWIRIEDGLKL